MSFDHWLLFVGFWAFFVATPGPNAVNCISNGMALGFRRAMVGVLAILTHATVFLTLSALGMTALIAASPTVFLVGKVVGAGFLIWMGVRGWINATKPAPAIERPARHVYTHALAVATLNPKSIAGYLATFTQVVRPDIPMTDQMALIYPTALTITALSYTCFTALGAIMGRAAIGALFNIWVRRVLSVCFIIYGVLLGTLTMPSARG